MSQWAKENLELKAEEKKLKADIKRLKTEPEVTQYVLKVDTSLHIVTERWIEDVCEKITGYGYVQKWELIPVDKASPMLQVNFEITADNEPASFYVDNIIDDLLYVGIDVRHSGGVSLRQL